MKIVVLFINIFERENDENKITAEKNGLRKTNFSKRKCEKIRRLVAYFGGSSQPGGNCHKLQTNSLHFLHLDATVKI